MRVLYFRNLSLPNSPPLFCFVPFPRSPSSPRVTCDCCVSTRQAARSRLFVRVRRLRLAHCDVASGVVVGRPWLTVRVVVPTEPPRKPRTVHNDDVTVLTFWGPRFPFHEVREQFAFPRYRSTRSLLLLLLLYTVTSAYSWEREAALRRRSMTRASRTNVLGDIFLPQAEHPPVVFLRRLLTLQNIPFLPLGNRTKIDQSYRIFG